MAFARRSQSKRYRGRAKRLVRAERLPPLTVSLTTIPACARATASSVRWRTECELFAVSPELPSARRCRRRTSSIRRTPRTEVLTAFGIGDEPADGIDGVGRRRLDRLESQGDPERSETGVEKAATPGTATLCGRVSARQPFRAPGAVPECLANAASAEQVDDRQQDRGADKRHEQSRDAEIVGVDRAGTEHRCDDEAGNEGLSETEGGFEDDPLLAVCLHHETRKPTKNASNQKPYQKVHASSYCWLALGFAKR